MPHSVSIDDVRHRLHVGDGQGVIDPADCALDGLAHSARIHIRPCNDAQGACRRSALPGTPVA